MHWTYRDLMDTPQHVYDALIDHLTQEAAQAEEAARAPARARRR
jgi:hypothetical protein